MKIAFLMQESRMGGIEYNSVHLAEALDKSRWAIFLCAPADGKLINELQSKKSLLFCTKYFFKP